MKWGLFRLSKGSFTSLTGSYSNKGLESYLPCEKGNRVKPRIRIDLGRTSDLDCDLIVDFDRGSDELMLK